MKPLAEVEVPSEVFHSEGFKPPSKYYFRNASGDYVYIKTRKRDLAQAHIDAIFGPSFFVIRSE